MIQSETEIEVRYAETDQMGVVHHSNYIVWCELGRTHFVKKLGFSYEELEAAGIVSPVINIDLNYKSPVYYGDTVLLRTWLAGYDGIRVIYGYAISNKNGELCAEGTSSHVCVNTSNFRPISIKKHLPEWDKAYENHKQ